MLYVPDDAPEDLAWVIEKINEAVRFPSGTVAEWWQGVPARVVFYRRRDDYIVIHCEGADPRLSGAIADVVRADGYAVSDPSHMGIRFSLTKR